jgi:hypothetical protein
MTADVTMPALNSVTGRSNAVVSFDQFEPANFTLDLSGNAVAEGELNAAKIDVIGDANAQARLAGATDSLDVRGKGNAVFTMPELEAKQVSVEMDNNSMAAVQATGSLDYALSGNAGLTYSGNPKLGKQQTGANAWAKQK